MKNYLCWSLRQLYLLCFWPTQFKREVEGNVADRLIPRFSKVVLYLLKMVPWMVTFGALGNLVAGYLCEVLEITFRWGNSWVGVALGVALGAAGGLVIGVAADVAGGLAFGVAGGVAGGLAFGAAIGAVGSGTGYAAGVAAGSTAGGVAFGVAVGAERSAFDVAVGVAVGVASGVAGGVAFGAAAGAIAGTLVLLTYFRLMVYPFELALSAATYFTGRWRSRAVAQAWRWCPVAWDEVIWLPLPFAGGLLALLAKQDREEGFKQIAFVAAERPLQTRVAASALSEVAAADLKAKSLSQLADVTERLSWTTDAPAGLPDELAATLPRLDRVAQHVGQYLTLHSPYRKGEALGRAVKEVESLQQSLIAARGRFAPRLLQVVNEWRGLLDAERDKLKTLAEASREIPNPFVYGNAVVETEHNVFTGRRDVVRQIEASLLGAAQAPTLLLQGPRRMGKTSILNQLPRLLGPDFAPAVVDCQNPAVTGSEATLLRYLSKALSEGLRRRRVSVEELRAQQLAREPYAVFDEWLERVERAMPAGMRALLCLDEYERLQSALDAGWGAPLLDSLRHTFQHRPRVVLMFTGAHTFQELGPAWTDRFISARRMRVSFLRRKDVELLLTKPIPEFDMTYAPGALDALVAATSCHPFLTQAVAFELVQLMNEAQRREATTADVEEAVGRALVSGDAYFVNVWGDAGAEGQAILRALAAGETPPDFTAARAWLREHDVIGADGDFAVKMMRRWVVSRAAAL
jgi:hypothetical protein